MTNNNLPHVARKQNAIEVKPSLSPNTGRESSKKNAVDVEKRFGEQVGHVSLDWKVMTQYMTMWNTLNELDQKTDYNQADKIKQEADSRQKVMTHN